MPRTKFEKDEDKLSNEKGKMKVKCPYCGHRIHFYAFEKKGKQICRYCGKYVFKDKKTEFEYRLKEQINKKGI